MKVKMILPALTEAKSPSFRPIKYALFPPLGLATLAAYLEDEDEVTIEDEHVGTVELDDQPDLVAIEAYITSAKRAYELADYYRMRGAHVCIGGLHPTSRPEEAARYADTIFLGPGEDTWPQFLRDFRAGRPKAVYRSIERTLVGAPRPRRDLIDRSRYLMPNSIVVSRGCPHNCDFCYKTSFFEGGRSFYTRAVDEALAEIADLPGRHLYFLDDNLMGNPQFASALFEGMRGMHRVWSAGGTVQAALDDELVQRAAASGMRSLFIGFETLSADNLRGCGKSHNLHANYEEAIARLRALGVMVNASFVFGMDDDDPGVFDRTVEWAIEQGVETATFHILTPYPGTPLHARMQQQGRILTEDTDLYDTRHAVFQPARMSPQRLEEGYWRAYRDFYSWGSIVRAAGAKETLRGQLRHLTYTGAWKKAEPIWDAIIRARMLGFVVPLMEGVMSIGRRGEAADPQDLPAAQVQQPPLG